ncbi:uncharacterized protein KIAA1614 homolog isoform X2 [Choloepus didactylus]|uniref:uncharacterized protein KIAA1614 homolog isoform X2 n=1 Tax=Choloepus didactylus TaxID=27675 RepID=UPI00189EADEC|nr:uncharacterized protein KIAA1614 homolog isoform X2 [Choloepus didactylus]
MEGMEAEETAPEATTSARGGPQGPKIVSRTAIAMEVTSAVEKSGPKQQLDKGHLPRPWSCPQEDRAPHRTAPHPPTAWRVQLQGPSVLESKVRALKEKIAGKQGGSPGPTSQGQPSSKKPNSCRMKASGTRTPAEGSSGPNAVVGAQSLTDSTVNQEEAVRNDCPRPSRLPAPAFKSWSGRSLWPSEATWMLPDHERGLLPGPSSLQESPIHRVNPSWPGGPGPCHQITHTPSPKTGRSCHLRDGPATGGNPDNVSVVSQEDFVPRMALLGGLWRAGDLWALGAGDSPLSLSDQVERNRLLLQEMLSVSGQGPPKAGVLTWTPSWDQAVPERPAGDVDWDSGISLQDSDQNRTFGPKPEPVPSPRHEEAKHLLQHAHVKARTRPLRASHDIVPTIAQGSRDGRRSPTVDPRMALACRDSPQNGNMSDSSSGESSSGQCPKRSASPSHVRFEDESACDAEFRYLERLQQRQRQVLSLALPTGDQGPLRSKPDLADYISGGVRRRDAGEGALHRLVGRLDWRGLPASPPTPAGSSEKCRACSRCTEGCRPAEGKVPPDPTGLQELEAACGVEGVLAEPCSSGGLSSPLSLLPPEQRPRQAEWVRETYTGDSVRLEEADSALDSTDTSDSCRTDSEEAGASQPSRARGRPRSGSPWLQGSRSRGGHRGSRKTQTELPRGPQTGHPLSGVNHLEVGEEAKEDRGHTREGAFFPREDAVPKPPALEPKRASLGSQQQPGPGLGNHWAHPADPWAPCRTACAWTPFMKLRPSGPGRQGQAIGSPDSPEIASTSSLQHSHAESSAPHQAQLPTASPSPAGWVPTPPSTRKTTSPVPRRKAALARPCRAGDQGGPVDTPLPPPTSEVPRTCELTSTQTSACNPQMRHRLLSLSSNNCNNISPQGPQDPWRGATPEGRAERGPGSQEPEPSQEKSRDGRLQGSPCSAAVGTISNTGITLSLAPEEPESSQEPEGGLQRTELSSGGCTPSRASPGVSAGPSPPSAAPSEKNRKSSSSSTSTLRLKRFFSALGQGTRPKLGKSHSYSVEQLQPPASGTASNTSSPKVKRSPSLQFLHLVSPSNRHRKAASFQNLHSLLSSRADRSSLYLVGEPGDHRAAGRPAKAPPRRALSVEDVGAPSLARTVGRVVEVFPDGTSQLQLQRSPDSTFGFCVASGNGPQGPQASTCRRWLTQAQPSCILGCWGWETRSSR